MWYPGKAKRSEPEQASLEQAGPQQATPELTSDLTSGCERMLDGSYLDSRCASAAGVPCWAWLNKITHCSEAELVMIARRPIALDGRPELHAWSRTLSFLAHELVQSAARSGRSVIALQRQALVPLELDLLGRVFGPSELTRRVLVALEDTAWHRS